MRVIFRKVHKALTGVAMTGIILPLAIAAATYFKPDAPQTAGVVQIERNSAYILFGAPTMFNGSDAPQFGLTLNNQPVPLGHLELRSYTLHNLSGRNLAKADFESPITIKAVPGQRIIYVGVNPAHGHAPVNAALSGDTQAVIDPMLLNINETVSINILLYWSDGVPTTAEDPFTDDSGVLSWTADIKGADLSVVGAHKPDFPNTRQWGVTLYTAHMGYGAIALVIVGFLLSALQIAKFGATKPSQPFDKEGIGWLAGRVTLAWFTADAIVRMFDYQVVPIFTWWNNWSAIGLFVVTMIFPLPPDLLADEKTQSNQTATL